MNAGTRRMKRTDLRCFGRFHWIGCLQPMELRVDWNRFRGYMICFSATKEDVMQLSLLKCKIHRATITSCDLDYEGSISIDGQLMKKAGLLPFERVDVLNINNGERLTTYVIEAEPGSGTIGLNGAAARKAMNGDRVIIVAYCEIEQDEAISHKPTILLMDEKNRISEIIDSKS